MHHVRAGGTPMMSRHLLSSTLAVAFAAFAVVSVHAQEAARAPQAAAKPTPRAADGHPDLSGVWAPGAGRGIRTDESQSVKVVLTLEGIDQNKDNVFAALDRISVTERDKDANKP